MSRWHAKTRQTSGEERGKGFVSSDVVGRGPVEKREAVAWLREVFWPPRISSYACQSAANEHLISCCSEGCWICRLEFFKQFATEPVLECVAVPRWWVKRDISRNRLTHTWGCSRSHPYDLLLSDVRWLSTQRFYVLPTFQLVTPRA
jgi:hypothetical protein